MVLNIKELNLDKDKKYIVFFDGNVDDENVINMHDVKEGFVRIGVDNNNIFYFPYPIIR